MAGFIRRFLFDPGQQVLLAIEGIDIIDREPPQTIIGTGSGTVCIVGEFENGPFNVSTETTSYTDMKSNFGVFGYTYNGVIAQNPCARARKSDNAVVAESWNGNAAVQLNGKKFSRLVLCRVDTSVGQVTFTRQAALLGNNLFRYSMLTGQNITISVDGAGGVAATFNGVAATVTGTAGTFNPATGDTATFGYDVAANFTVTFFATDNTNLLMLARINAAAGFAFASNVAGQIAITGLQPGTGGQVRVVSGSAGTLTKLGLVVATTAGTGNVANIAAVTPAELNTVISAAVATVKVEQLASGQIRLARTSAAPATDSVAVTSATTITTLGFAIGTTSTAATATASVIPAGTVVQVPAGQVFVTMQDINVTASTVTNIAASGAGPYSVKVRHATDDGTGVLAAAGAINLLPTPTPLGSFAVVNLLATTAALTESAIDAAYITAIDATLNPGDVSAQINVQYAARQSNAVRRELKSVALLASANGLLGRTAVLRTPLGTTSAAAQSTSAEPGVGAYRDQRVVFCWPQARTLVPAMASIGIAGGAGFSADGTLDVGADGFMASILSQLPPEENPGQATTFTGGCIALESSAFAQSLSIVDYINCKAAGIAALRFDNGAAIFQSGVTSVDPIANASLVRIARRRMADFIQDSLALALKPFTKKLMTVARRKAIEVVVRSFLNGLLSPTNANTQRINAYLVDGKSGNTQATLAVGEYRLIILVQTTPSMDDIVLDTTIGDTVVIAQAA